MIIEIEKPLDLVIQIMYLNARVNDKELDLPVLDEFMNKLINDLRKIVYNKEK